MVVRINDRGPFVGDRIIDLSYTAAAKLDMLTAGTAPVDPGLLTRQARVAILAAAKRALGNTVYERVRSTVLGPA